MLEKSSSSFAWMGSKPMQVMGSCVYRGPNLHSRLPVVRIRLDLGDLEERPSNLIPDFTERLLAELPGLQDHGCSYGEPGGFVRRLREGTWLGHIAE
ncbi:MAG: cyanophycin synthetase, partial [Rubritepida sp.]|nr:cyanophycin synthetase [Rubritepida sp.]